MMSEYSSKTRCLVCGSADVLACLDIGRVPVHCNLLWPSREEATKAPMGDMRLGFCASCGHLFNMAFDPDLMGYTQDYENSLHFSPRFQSYARSLAERLIENHNLHRKTVIEIGCGKGEFLALLCELGHNRGIGFDPSYVHQRSLNGYGEQITFVQDFYSERYAHYEADLICCRHVLEHIHNPTDFLTNLRRAIGDRLDTEVFFEVPDALFTLRDLAIWDIIYEHCSYFTRHSLARAFALSGFVVRNLGSAFEDQFLCIDAAPGDISCNAALSDREEIEKMAVDVTTFADKYRSKISAWQGQLNRIEREGKRAVVWGAGSKGVTFLNALKDQDYIRHVVDLNPYKHGMHIARTGQQIVPPEFLRDYRPDVVIVMNSIYKEEIRQITESLDLRVDFVYA